MKKEIIYVVVTKHKEYIHTLASIGIEAQLLQFKCTENNSSSLAQVYNQHLFENKDNILVFMHDDFLLEDAFAEEKIRAAIDLYDVIGLAGTVGPITVQKPALWHLMAPQTSYRGAVAHYAKEGNQRWMTSFGNTPDRVVLADGVFLAVNAEKLLDNGIKFDESNPARFHYYDLDLCLQANRKKLKVGVYPIWGTHASPGLTNPDEEFLKGQDWFLNKWG